MPVDNISLYMPFGRGADGVGAHHSAKRDSSRWKHCSLAAEFKIETASSSGVDRPSRVNSKNKFPAHLGHGAFFIATHDAPGLSPVSVPHYSREGVQSLLSRAVRDPLVARQLRAKLASSSQGHAQIFRLNNREVVRQIVDLVVRGEIVIAPSSVVTLAPKKGKAYKHGDRIGDPVKFDKTLAAAVAQKTGVPDPSAERSARTIAESLTVILVGVVRQSRGASPKRRAASSTRMATSGPAETCRATPLGIQTSSPDRAPQSPRTSRAPKTTRRRLCSRSTRVPKMHQHCRENHLGPHNQSPQTTGRSADAGHPASPRLRDQLAQ